MDVEVKIDGRSMRRMTRTIKRAPVEVKKAIKKRWGVSTRNFITLMQNKHLEGGTTADRLNRISSNLYSGLRDEIVLTSDRINVAVWFYDKVSDYAPTHEYGDPERNIPARMNLTNEWDKYKKIFADDAEAGIAEGLRNV